MTSIAPVGSVSAVLARIGQIEQRLGVRRTLPIDTATATPGISGASGTPVTSATSAAMAAADPSAGITDLMGLNGTDSIGSATSSVSTAAGGASFDQVFAAAVAELRQQWSPTTSATAPAPASTTASPASTAATPSSVVTVTTRTGTTSVGGAVSAATPYAQLFETAGAAHGIPPKVLAAIGYVESRFQTDAISSAGAVGMMQFLPTTAASMGVDPSDPASAIDGAARYLRSALDRFGSLDQAIASYNVGPGSIARSGGVQPGSQAERYLTKVLDATGRI